MSRSRAWQYMGTEEVFGFVNHGDHYIDSHPWTPDDIPLAPPVEVTAEDWIAVQPGVSVLLAYELAEAMTERLTARQEGE